MRDEADEIFLKLPPPNPAARSNVELLMAMGFPEDQVQRALEYAYNNVELAATYLMEGATLIGAQLTCVSCRQYHYRHYHVCRVFFTTCSL